MRLLRKQRAPTAKTALFFKNHLLITLIFQKYTFEQIRPLFYSNGGGDGLNQVVLVGRTTKDLEVKYVGEQQRARAQFTLAVDRRYKNELGQADTDFISCVVWGKTAENMQKYCGKGSMVAVTGRIQSYSYTNQQNEKVYGTQVNVEDAKFLDKRLPANNPDPLLDFQTSKTELENLPF